MGLIHDYSNIAYADDHISVMVMKIKSVSSFKAIVVCAKFMDIISF